MFALLVLCRIALVPKKKFKCFHDGCTLSFPCVRNVTRHRLTHTDEEPFQCPICNNRFTRPHNLDAHLIVPSATLHHERQHQLEQKNPRERGFQSFNSTPASTTPARDLCTKNIHINLATNAARTPFIPTVSCPGWRRLVVELSARNH